ncbi:glucosyltransferase domain-containing protein [Arsenophonus apicola]|uniref:Glucosyltransferase domain-containing protein n=1 Tax=Arsenophonus apicola TaxID=2879119 RepID=A0ABY8P1Z6_9GAMM|nr:glucosyltransferase domain-containing protein [Arsenophonus apicola]WGO83061.1 glucosyltransferase domain-containing protein [Arsenophonus apicola]
MKKLTIKHYILVSLLLSIPVILLNTYYADDLYRITLGTYGWESDARLLSVLVYYILGLGGSLSDLYPIGQMLAYVMLGITAYIVSSKIIENKNIIGMAITSPIITSPLLLGNLLYRFDSLTMMAGVLCATAPFCFRKNNFFIIYTLTPLFLLSSLSFYQASSIVFVSISIMEFFKNAFKDENIIKSIKQLINRSLGLIIGFLLFKIITDHFVSKNAYAEELSKIIPINFHAPEKILDTLLKSMDLIMMFDKGGIGFIIKALLIITLISSINIVVKKLKEKGTCSSLKIFFTICFCFTVSFLCIPGFILLANTPVFYPRLYIGFGLFFVFCLYIIYIAIDYKYIRYLFFIIPLSFTSINLVTVNAVNNQNLNNNAFISEFKNDIYNIVGLNNFIDVTFYGELRRPKSVVNSITKYPFIEWIVGSYFHWSYDGGKWELERNGLSINLSKPDIANNVIKRHNNENPIAVRQNYNLFLIDKHLVVAFK